jgi:hypothetical protein
MITREVGIQKFQKKTNHCTPSEVYIMKCLDFYKIGVSTYVEERRSAIQACNPTRVEIIYQSGSDFPPSKRAFGFEYDYHCLLKDYWIGYEWFDLSEENVENVIEWIKDDFANVKDRWKNKIYAIYEPYDESPHKRTSCWRGSACKCYH